MHVMVPSPRTVPRRQTDNEKRILTGDSLKFLVQPFRPWPTEGLGLVLWMFFTCREQAGFNAFPDIASGCSK